MLQKKRKIDKIFLILFLITLLLGLIDIELIKEVSLGILIGFGVASYTFEKDIKRIEANNFNKMQLNMAINIVLYAAALTLANLITFNTFIVAAIILVAYRYILVAKLKK